MPRLTFYNLSEEKRSSIEIAAIEEFSSRSFREASINQICKKCKMAKGSFYQYFDDKLDLYEYIMNKASDEKVEFFSNVLTNFQNLGLFEKIRLLYVKGIEFSYTHPLLAALGAQLSKETDEDVKRKIFKGGEAKANTFFCMMIDQAKESNEVSKNISSEALSELLQSLNQSVYARFVDNIERMEYKDIEYDLLSYVDELTNIIENGVTEGRKK